MLNRLFVVAVCLMLCLNCVLAQAEPAASQVKTDWSYVEANILIIPVECNRRVRVGLGEWEGWQVVLTGTTFARDSSGMMTVSIEAVNSDGVSSTYIDLRVDESNFFKSQSFSNAWRSGNYSPDFPICAFLWNNPAKEDFTFFLDFFSDSASRGGTPLHTIGPVTLKFRSDFTDPSVNQPVNITLPRLGENATEGVTYDSIEIPGVLTLSPNLNGNQSVVFNDENSSEWYLYFIANNLTDQPLSIYGELAVGEGVYFLRTDPMELSPGEEQYLAFMLFGYVMDAMGLQAAYEAGVTSAELRLVVYAEGWDLAYQPVHITFE